MEDRLDAICESWGIDAQKKKMFGGICYMVSGKMAFATMSTGELIVRVPPDKKTELLARDHIEQAYMGHRKMDNWATVAADKLSDDELEPLLAIGRDYAIEKSEENV